uniref:Uncharacterized protein LOC101497250 n=1 Tax=Cicer arietinum TaxID=3827 RepID=A0A3Q7XGP1_CICAR|nr:uncharacterized protein LOC101497250 [Cicer arietinum]
MAKDRKHDYNYEETYEKYEKKMKRSFSVSSDHEDDAKRMNGKVSIQELTHKCNICGKTFSNGKALGGHRRSHFQAAKKKPNSQKEPTCYLCKKKFPSKNALYGHMRSHPFRVCKGVSPPSNHNSSSNSNSNSNSSSQQNKEDQDDDGDCSLPKWQKRDKRGRKCIGSAEAANNLVHLRSNVVNMSINVPKSVDEFPIPSKKGESSTIVVNKIKFFFGSSLKIGNQSDIGNGGESHNIDKELKKGNGNGLVSESRVDENTNDGHSAEQKKLEFDLNEPYVRED